MASPKKHLLEFEKAIEYMDSVQVTDYLHKTLHFLKSNNNELCFPNISSYTEAFLVGLITNLKSKSLNFSNKRFASEIIQILELNRDVFRWTYGYENGNLTKNLLVYKKIFSNKIKMKPAEFKKPASSISHRLLQAQKHETKQPTDKQSEIQTCSKIHLLNMTLRFLKNSAERTLYYPEMPLIQAQYIYSLIRNPKSNSSVGFGYKSLYAPLFEAMDVYGLDYEFRIYFVETNNSETAALKLEKVPRKTNNSSKGDSSLNSSSSSSKLSKKERKRRNKSNLLNGVTAQFMSDTLQTLVEFTGDAARATVTFDRLTDEEMGFIRGVKTLAGSPESYSMFDPQLRVSLKQLHCNIAEVMRTCKIRIEEGQTKKTRARFITLKKVPREICPVPPLRPITRSRSAASAKSRDRSVSKKRSTGKERSVSKNRSMSKERSTKKDGSVRKNRSDSKDRLIQFKSAGKFIPSTEQLDASGEQGGSRGGEQGGAGVGEEGPERGGHDRLNKRKTKLLEDMSVPLESDIGMRMMMLMGWRGGALGARGHGILEPLLPAIDLPVGAGLGHVPPPKPETRPIAAFRADLLHNLRDLLTLGSTEKQLEYRLPVSKKEKKFLNTALDGLNKRKSLGVTLKVEVDLVKQLLLEMQTNPELELRAEISQDLKKVTLIKTQNPNQKHLKKPKQKKVDKSTSITVTKLNAHAEYDLINDDHINMIINDVIPTINTSCKTPVAIKARATRILFLMRFIDFVKGKKEYREFRFEGTLQKKFEAFLGDVVVSVNSKVRSGYVTQEEFEWFEELMKCADGFLLTIEFLSKSKFILSKKERQNMQYQSRFVNSVWPHPADNNNDVQTNNQNHSKDTTKSSEKKNNNNKKPIELPKCSRKQKIIDATKDEQVEFKDEIVDSTKKEVQPLQEKKVKSLKQTIPDMIKQAKAESPEQEIQYIFITKPKQVEILELTNEDNHKPSVLEDDTPDERVKVENNCDIECKNNGVENIAKKETIQVQKETDDILNGDDSLCVCDTKLGTTELDKDVTGLELAILKADLNIQVKEEFDNASPGSKRSRTNSTRQQETDAKKTKITQIKNLLIISPSNPEKKINAEMVKDIQTRISNATDECVDFLPLLKCHGVQNEGLIYSCHDESDVDWLKNVISSADLDLKINNDDDFCIDRKSRKLVIKINSFIPLDTKKVFSRIELYNNGLDTSGWRVLSEQTYSHFLLFIVEVDEKSFKYISGAGLSLYVGLDKAQFSIIF